MPRRPVCILKVGKILRTNPKRCKFESISANSNALLSVYN